MTAPKDNKRRTLIPLSKWPQAHQWPSVGGLRYLIANKEKNGFEGVFRRAGKLILIDEDLFFKWVDKRDKCSNNP